MFSKINQCDVYVGMWCIYMLQEVLYSPGIINQILQLMMLLWSMTALFRYLIDSTSYSYSSILNASFILIVMYTIYGTIHIMFDNPINGQSTHYYLQSALNSLAPIFLFYDFTMNGKLTKDRIRIYLPILVFVSILLYYKTESQMLLLKDVEEITNNAGYFFVSLIPFLFFYSKRPILQFVFLAIILLFVFMGMKRGAILTCVIGTIILLYSNMRNSSRWKRVLFVALTIINVFVIFMYIDYMMNNSAYFMARVEETFEGNSSGRDVIYGTLWDTIFSESNPLYFYLGRGANSTIAVIGNVAHQDWLETFCNNGLVGVMILFFFFFTMGRNAWSSRHYFSNMIFYSFVTLFIITFSKTLFSMSIQELDLSESMLIGFFAYWMTQSLEEVEEQKISE